MHDDAKFQFSRLQRYCQHPGSRRTVCSRSAFLQTEVLVLGCLGFHVPSLVMIVPLEFCEAQLLAFQRRLGLTKSEIARLARVTFTLLDLVHIASWKFGLWEPEILSVVLVLRAFRITIPNLVRNLPKCLFEIGQWIPARPSAAFALNH